MTDIILTLAAMEYALCFLSVMGTEMRATEVDHNKFHEAPMLVPSLFRDQAKVPWRMPSFKKRLLILGTGELAVDLCQIIDRKSVV